MSDYVPEDAARRPALSAVLRGLLRRCPKCGLGGSMRGYLKVREACAECGEPLGHFRADDFPPYLTILVVGHIVVPLVLLVEQNFAPSLAVQMIAWPLLTLFLTLLTLPFVKGGVLGLMWALERPQGPEL